MIILRPLRLLKGGQTTQGVIVEGGSLAGVLVLAHDLAPRFDKDGLFLEQMHVPDLFNVLRYLRLGSGAGYRFVQNAIQIQ